MFESTTPFDEIKFQFTSKVEINIHLFSFGLYLVNNKLLTSFSIVDYQIKLFPRHHFRNYFCSSSNNSSALFNIFASFLHFHYALFKYFKMLL